MSNSSIIAALAAALDANPDDVPLRLHLAGLLLGEGDAASALDHFTRVLGREPANLDALQGAERAARATGDLERADGYARLLGALGAAPPAAAPAQIAAAVPQHETGGEPQRPKLQVVAGGAQDLETWELERPDVVLADVGGMVEVKRRLHISFLAPLKNPEMMKAYGKSLRGGLLLYGPPGCGKTFIARAAAGELGAKFLSVGLSDVLDMWFGESERHLHEIFEAARRNAPSILFFDEIDAIGQRRTHLKHHGPMRNVVNQLLSELDSTGSDNAGVFTLAATNHPWDVDAALRRPGRFDRLMLVLPPDAEARKAIFEYHLRHRPVGAVDFKLLVSKTNGFSGADIALLCEAAAEAVLEESLASGSMRPIDTRDFVRALGEVKPSTRAWFETARNYAMFANEGGMYDDLLAYMKANKLV